MKLKKVDYADLNSKQKEIYNFQKVASLLADYGFNCIKLTDDWQGADFLAYHKDGTNTLKVQLKSRVSIAEKYRGKGLYMVFPISGDWYLIEHDRLLQAVGKHTGWLESQSWRERGGYSSVSVNTGLLSDLHRRRL